MIEAKPKSIFSWDFSIFETEKKIADLDLSWLREKAIFTLGNTEYEIRRDSAIRGSFSLLSGGQIIASAQKTSAFIRRFQIDYSGRTMELSALHIFSRTFCLFDNNLRLGSISPTGWPGRNANIDLPKEISVPVQLFLFCLVVFLWRRAASDAQVQANP